MVKSFLVTIRFLDGTESSTDVMGAGIDCHARPCQAVPRDTPENDSEFIFIDLLFSYNRKVTLGVFYRPPNNDPKPLEDLEAALQDFFTNEPILLGYFNLPEIDWLHNRVLRQSDIYMLMMDIVHDNFLTQLINEPTRDSNILDLVLTTSPDLVNHLFIGEPFSDHNSISFLLCGTPYVQRKSQKQLYCYRGFARQPCWMAGTIDSFSHGNKCSF